MLAAHTYAGTTLVLRCWRGAEGTCIPHSSSNSNMHTIPSEHTRTQGGNRSLTHRINKTQHDHISGAGVRAAHHSDTI